MSHRFWYTKEHNTFRAYYLEDFFSSWFCLQPFDASAVLASDDVLLLSLPETTNWLSFKDIPGQTLDTVKAIIVDNLQEPMIDNINILAPWKHKTLVLTAGQGHKHSDFNLLIVPEWFWYFEALWYRSRDYHLYRPGPDKKSKLFFMPIRRKKPGRDLAYQGLQSLLDQSVYSYVERGVVLPGIPDAHREDQRWFNPDWYDSTCFSVVCEDDDDSYPVMWSEKSCKPLAFFHPFVVVAQQGLLALIRAHGFQTFPEIFDESYDSLPHIDQRAAAVCGQILHKKLDDFRAPEIVERVRFNQARFFDSELIKRLMITRLVEPLLEFLDGPAITQTK